MANKKKRILNLRKLSGIKTTLCNLIFSGRNSLQTVARKGYFRALEKGKHRGTQQHSKMSPQLILPKHKVRAASRLINNLKNCSGKKPAAAAAASR